MLGDFDNDGKLDVTLVDGSQVKLFKNGCGMMQVKEAVSLHGHDYTWKQLNDRFGSFATGTRPAAALAMSAMLPKAEVK